MAGAALLIVDFQNDFLQAGADELADRINALAASGRFDLVIAARDWHPVDHRSFTAIGGALPVHCVADSPGAQLHPALNQAAIHKIIDKGVDPDSDGTSAFDGTGLSELLHNRGITQVTVVGLGTDHAVRASALDALAEGFDVEVDTEAVRGLSVQPGDDQKAIDEMLAAGVTRAR